MICSNLTKNVIEVRRVNARTMVNEITIKNETITISGCSTEISPFFMITSVWKC